MTTTEPFLCTQSLLQDWSHCRLKNSIRKLKKKPEIILCIFWDHYGVKLTTNYPQSSQNTKLPNNILGNRFQQYMTDDMIIYMWEPKHSIKRLLELIREWQGSKHKISEDKSIAFASTNNSMVKNKLVRTMWFKRVGKKIKLLATNLTKEARDL